MANDKLTPDLRELLTRIRRHNIAITRDIDRFLNDYETVEVKLGDSLYARFVPESPEQAEAVAGLLGSALRKIEKDKREGKEG